MVSAIRDLPIPGSPEISTTQPSPRFACSHRRRSRSTSSSRPTSGVVGVRSASKRLSTALGRSAPYARTAPFDALELVGSEVLKLEQITEQLSRALGDDDRVRLGDPLQARREVGCLADDRLLLSRTRPDQSRLRPRAQ